MPVTSFQDSLKNFVATATFAGTTGYLAAYIYGKSANLPADQVAKVYTIAKLSRVIFGEITQFLFRRYLPISPAISPDDENWDNVSEDECNKFYRNYTIRQILTSALRLILGGITIYELQKRGLIGDKMKIFMAAARIYSVAGIWYPKLDTSFPWLSQIMHRV